MQDTTSIPQVDLPRKQSQEETIEFEEPTPSIEAIITAPEDDWRRLCALAEADTGMMLALRVRRQLQESGQLQPKSRRRGSRRRSRPSTSTRHFSASSVLQSQALIGAAMVETLERVNDGDLDGEGSRFILVTAGEKTLIMEVVA